MGGGVERIPSTDWLCKLYGYKTGADIAARATRG